MIMCAESVVRPSCGFLRLLFFYNRLLTTTTTATATINAFRIGGGVVGDL